MVCGCDEIAYHVIGSHAPQIGVGVGWGGGGRSRKPFILALNFCKYSKILLNEPKR